MSVTRAVRLTFLCTAATLVACGRSPVPVAQPDPATIARSAAQVAGGQNTQAPSVELTLTADQAQQLRAAAGQTPPAAQPVAPSAAGPSAGDAAASGTEAPKVTGDGNYLDGSEAAAGADKDLDLAGLAAQVERVLGPAPAGIANGASDGTLAAAAATKTKKRASKFKSLGFWGSGPDVADRVYGNLGWSYANLYWDDYYGTINGTLDGRRVYLTDSVDSLYGSIGWSTVDLRRYSGWWNDTIKGYLGGHYVNMQVNNGSLKGYEGSTYLNTGTTWNGRLGGSYGGYKVSVTNSSGNLNGYIGSRTVKINGGWSAMSGYMGNKSVYLQGDLSSSALLRRLPLLAANDWMVISTLTEFFD